MMRNNLSNQFTKVSGCLSIVLIASLLGCGGAEDTRPVRNSVFGTVTYQGTPVEGAVITFRPAGPEGQTANGRTDETGTFQMGTFEGSDGVVPGEYTVMITKLEAASSSQALPEDDPNYDPNPKAEAPPKNLLPKKYANADTSELTVSVPAGEDLTGLTFELND
ncbi:carboxypeptidase-like regulatory domain-containing protein [uncultured Gimesia sp.]|mgnify:CR=1 FL=1|uniref:carboxypeptidase-like regulatory domain-containing protein n=1 Tax=uncultured Gimesia sp. TaxID=1678688 RepID=UPI0030DB6B70|tara:strand:+ start:9824 stop:10315 length:492 start_codon:yes stop_codon:yes gene_type:complete